MTTTTTATVTAAAPAAAAGGSNRYQWDRSHPGLTSLQKAIEPVRHDVIGHRVYGELNSHERVQAFLASHVYAVWDFMSLLKTLQRQLTCVRVPWVPEGPPASRRLINDIVLVEESDERSGGFISHFELYLDGMTQAGAGTAAVRTFLSLLRSGEPVPLALKGAGTPAPAAEFVTATWEFIEQSPVHCQAAAFAFGREDLIPDMFHQVAVLNEQVGNRLSAFVEIGRA